MNNYLLVFIAGGAGSALRYHIGKMSGTIIYSLIPAGTLIVNIIGAAIAGAALAYADERNMSEKLWLLIVAGFCGGFSTFSAFSVELFSMIREGLIIQALIYALISVIVSVIALFGTYSIIRTIL